MSAGKYSFCIEQGATLQKTIVYKDNSGNYVDLTGYSARMKIRPTTTSQDVYWSGTTETGELPFISEVSGTFLIFISATQSMDLDFDKGVYDLELYSGSFVTRLLEGNVNLSREVTR